MTPFIIPSFLSRDILSLLFVTLMSFRKICDFAQEIEGEVS